MELNKERASPLNCRIKQKKLCKFKIAPDFKLVSSGQSDKIFFFFEMERRKDVFESLL